MRTKISFFVIFAFCVLASVASAQPTPIDGENYKFADTEAERLINEIKPLLPGETEEEKTASASKIFSDCRGNPTCLEGVLVAIRAQASVQAKATPAVNNTTSPKDGEVNCEGGGRLVDGVCVYGEEVRVRAPILTVAQQRDQYEKDLQRVIEEMRDSISQEARRLGQEVREEDLKRKARARLKEEVCGGKKLGIFGSRRDEYTCEGWERIDFQENEAKEGLEAQKIRRARTHLSENCWGTTTIESSVESVIPFFSRPSTVLVFENPYKTEDLKVHIYGDDNLPVVKNLCYNGSLALSHTIRPWHGFLRKDHYIIRAYDREENMYSIDSKDIVVSRFQQFWAINEPLPTYRIRFPEYDRMLQMRAAETQESGSGASQGAPSRPGVRCSGPGSIHQRAIGNCSVSNDMPRLTGGHPPDWVYNRNKKK